MNTPGATLHTSIDESRPTGGLPQELGSRRAHFNDASGQTLTLHHRRHGRQTVPLHQPAGYPGGCRALSGRHDDPQAIVTAAAHGSAPGIDHEADQEAEQQEEREVIGIFLMALLAQT